MTVWAVLVGVTLVALLGGMTVWAVLVRVTLVGVTLVAVLGGMTVWAVLVRVTLVGVLGGMRLWRWPAARGLCRGWGCFRRQRS